MVGSRCDPTTIFDENICFTVKLQSKHIFTFHIKHTDFVKASAGLDR